MNDPHQNAEKRHLLGNIISFHAGAERTGSAYSLTEIATVPGAGTPPHVQRGDDEAFYVLEGSYEFMHEGRTFTASTGAFVFVGMGEAHAFRNVGATAARMLIINSPGGLHESFFKEAGDPIPAGADFPPPAAPDMPRLLAAAGRYGIEFLPPTA